MWAVDWVLDWLQQIGEGAVHNVANKITEGLKFQIRFPQINVRSLIKIYWMFSLNFSHHPVLFIENYYNCSVNMST